jgi:hypothetical protein
MGQTSGGPSAYRIYAYDETHPDDQDYQPVRHEYLPVMNARTPGGVLIFN